MTGTGRNDSIEMRRFLAKIQKDIFPALNEHTSNDDGFARGLTALVLCTIAAMPMDQSQKYVIDGGGDFAIDGLFHNAATKTVYFVQSKLRRNQNKTLSQGEVLKFTAGVSKIINGEIASANKKLSDAYPVILEALDDINTKIVLTVACTSLSQLEPDVEGELKRFCATQNKTDDAFSHKYIGFNELFQAAKLYSPSTSTDIDIRLKPYGTIESP